MAHGKEGLDDFPSEKRLLAEKIGQASHWVQNDVIIVNIYLTAVEDLPFHFIKTL